ncbi:MAG: ABC transporter permease [Clostridia bacterium]|nr:ABC transporter permease [Clostridia bacterium]
MSTFFALVRRNTKLFFKDKGMFFASLITPIILLVLYATFLAKVYSDSFIANIPEGFNIPQSIIDGLVGGELISSILAVSCVTVAFCSNLLMVQDKANGTINDLLVSPVKKSVLALSYYCATIISTLIICFAAMGVCFLYIGSKGFYMTLSDVLLLMLDIVLLVLFGTALSSVINFFLSTQGQISAVGTIVSAGYGFLCGAYMPISSFNEGLKKVILMLPGTYGTALVRNHCTRGVLEEMAGIGIPNEVIESIKDSIDCNLYPFDNKISVPGMYIVLCATILVLIAIYILMNALKRKKH